MLKRITSGIDNPVPKALTVVSVNYGVTFASLAPGRHGEHAVMQGEYARLTSHRGGRLGQQVQERYRVRRTEPGGRSVHPRRVRAGRHQNPAPFGVPPDEPGLGRRGREPLAG